MNIRWRYIQDSDPSWVCEIQDPAYKSRYPGEDVNGWKPLAFVWKWSASLGETPKPWRAQIAEYGKKSNLDYKSVEEAKKHTFHRLRRGGLI